MHVQAEILKWEQNCYLCTTNIWLELYFVVEKSKVWGPMTMGPNKLGFSIRSEAGRGELGRLPKMINFLLIERSQERRK